MQSKHQLIKVLFLLIFVWTNSQLGVSAQEVNSVKDCIEQPEKCSEENLIPEDTDNGNKENINENTVGVTAWDFIKMIFATIFVVALLYLLLKFINKKSHVYKSSQVVENIGGTSLGANRSVQIIKVGSRVLVLGVGENIQLLKEIEDEEEARRIIVEHNNKIEQLTSPSDIVTKVLNLRKALTTQEKEREKEASSFSSVLKNQLDHMSQDRKKLYDEMEKKGPDER
ncbi:flagellar biosynthetic protein FliO [Bacillus dakarensis]|uniref:flagellar biosynthetic protein FliO n=1 Tax=Robertmurraya dakarensis TaxID=1926278 RepID=UPI001F03147F|nr:flagellar biosynthetic protein FliO [Bacillus dakarensis]